MSDDFLLDYFAIELCFKRQITNQINGYIIKKAGEYRKRMFEDVSVTFWWSLLAIFLASISLIIFATVIYILKPRIHKKRDETTVEVERKKPSKDSIEVLSALLGFYSGRAVSFASLFVASIFGIVSFLAIIQGIGDNWQLRLVSIFPYVAFSIAGWYTYRKFSFYAEIAHAIEHDGLRMSFAEDLRNIYYEPSKDQLRKIGSVNNLYEFIEKMIGRNQRSTDRRAVSKFFLPLYWIIVIIMVVIVLLS